MGIVDHHRQVRMEKRLTPTLQVNMLGKPEISSQT
jgi:hypothetical protein